MNRTPSRAPSGDHRGSARKPDTVVKRFACSAVSGGDVDLELPLLVVIGKEREPPAIGRPGDRVFGTPGLAVARRDPSRHPLVRRQVGDKDARMPRLTSRPAPSDILDPGHPLTVGRDGRLAVVADLLAARCPGRERLRSRASTRMSATSRRYKSTKTRTEIDRMAELRGLPPVGGPMSIAIVIHPTA